MGVRDAQGCGLNEDHDDIDEDVQRDNGYPAGREDDAEDHEDRAVLDPSAGDGDLSEDEDDGDTVVTSDDVGDPGEGVADSCCCRSHPEVHSSSAGLPRRTTSIQLHC